MSMLLPKKRSFDSIDFVFSNNVEEKKSRLVVSFNGHLSFLYANHLYYTPLHNYDNNFCFLKICAHAQHLFPNHKELSFRFNTNFPNMKTKKLAVSGRSIERKDMKNKIHSFNSLARTSFSQSLTTVKKKLRRKSRNETPSDCLISASVYLTQDYMVFPLPVYITQSFLIALVHPRSLCTSDRYSCV